jgi:hypothetical protein
MPGLLSSVFEDGSDGTSQQSESVQTYDAAANSGIDLSPTVGVSLDHEASWQDADGTTHTYASDTDIILAVDVSATLTATGSLVGSSVEES